MTTDNIEDTDQHGGVDRDADDTAARLAALKAKGDSAAEEAAKPREETINWNKGVQEGDMIAGTLVRGAQVKVKGETKMRYLMEIRDFTTKDLYTVWCGAYLLEQAIIDVAPAKDTLVVVQYHGKQQSNKNPDRSFNVFTLEAEESDFAYWDDIRAKARAEAASVTAAPAARQSFGPDEAPF